MKKQEQREEKRNRQITKHKEQPTTASKGLLATFFALWSRPFIVVALLISIIVIALPIATFFYMKNVSTFMEQKGAYLERIQNLNELVTAEAYTKVIINQQDNEIFGQSIGVNVPGTKRQLLIVIPGSVRAGVDLSGLTQGDVQVNEALKTAKLTIPRAQFFGGAELFFEDVEVYSYEGLFRGEANIAEAYELAEEAKTLIVEEATAEGVLTTAEKNAERALTEMFSFSGYAVDINYKE